MTLDLSSLRAMRKTSTSALTKLTSELQKQETSNSSSRDDDRFWKAAVDKAGNGSAIIRFLPARDDDELPWVKLYSHGFQGPTGKWYIENCLTTIGQTDPVVEHCNELWNSGLESDKKIVGQRKRRLSYIANVLVIKDPANPENEGKVKLFKFGKKLFDKIKDKLQPIYEDEQPVDVFNPWEGANFRLRIAKVDGYSNTDKSVFDSPTAISEDDEEMLEILNGRHRLGEFIEPSQFKSYDDLKKKLDMVLSGGGAAQKKAAEFLLDEDEEEKPKATAKPPAREKPEPVKKVTAPVEEEDDLEFFKGLIDD
jgi:hypothetical protein